MADFPCHNLRSDPVFPHPTLSGMMHESVLGAYGKKLHIVRQGWNGDAAMRHLKVSLPAPCDESWDVMAPRGCNRHCSACDTIVHDLSALTVDEADALLDSDEPICVRASVRRDGTIRTATPAGPKSRRMVATIGAGVLLATAACQTVTLPAVSPRFHISGQLAPGSLAATARLRAGDGRTQSTRIGGDREFRFGNVRPGTYTLSFVDNCGERSVGNEIVVSDDLNLGAVVVNDENFCIIVGMMQRASDADSG